MTTLRDLIKQYDARTATPVVGDKVLFERVDDGGACSINLGEVTTIKPEGEFKEPSVRIRGIHTFFPDGSNQQFRGHTPREFSISHFAKTGCEWLTIQAERLESRASQIRTWAASLHR